MLCVVFCDVCYASSLVTYFMVNGLVLCKVILWCCVLCCVVLRWKVWVYLMGNLYVCVTKYL